MSFEEAEAMLANRRDGSFLVRDSSDERYILSLSFRSLGGTHHTRIEHYKGIDDMYFALQRRILERPFNPLMARTVTFRAAAMLKIINFNIAVAIIGVIFCF